MRRNLQLEEAYTLLCESRRTIHNPEGDELGDDPQVILRKLCYAYIKFCSDWAIKSQAKYPGVTCKPVICWTTHEDWTMPVLPTEGFNNVREYEYKTSKAVASFHDDRVDWEVENDTDVLHIINAFIQYGDKEYLTDD